MSVRYMQGDTVEATVKPHPVRCKVCNKKVGLTSFACRCGFTFCLTHSFSSKHSCVFDYKGLAKAQIERSNPVIAPAKL